MNWLTELYQQRQTTLSSAAARMRGQQQLAVAASYLTTVRDHIYRQSQGIFDPLSVHGGTAGALALFDEAMTDDVRRLAMTHNQGEFDAVCVRIAQSRSVDEAISVEREIQILSVLDWVTSLTVDSDALVVVTKDVIIEHDGTTYNFGQFTLRLLREQLTNYLAPQSEYIGTVIEIRGPRRYGAFYHPHVNIHHDVNDGGACFGDAEDRLVNHLKHGLISDVFLVIWAFLNTYNASSPLHEIENFDTPDVDRADHEDVATSSDRTFVHSVTGEHVSSDDLYECSSCGRFMSRSDRRTVENMSCCSACESALEEENDVCAAGSWLCFNCGATHRDNAEPALVRRGVKVCGGCINHGNGQVLVRFTTHWNHQQLFGGQHSISSFFEKLRPSSFTVDRFAPPTVPVIHNVQLDYAAVPGVPAPTRPVELRVGMIMVNGVLANNG